MTQEDYGIKVLKDEVFGESKDRNDFNFTSGAATYLIAKTVTVNVTSNPHVIIHGMNYIPKVLVFEILSDHNRKLPYDTGTGMRDFSITSNEVKIRGVTSGTFKVFIFAQSIL
jgi:hypothetical protein